jgi:predicted ATPase
VIRELVIEGFKRFEAQSLEIKPLTVLAGGNGAGKTSAIHALLLAFHAMDRHNDFTALNGPYGLELGWFEDIVNVNSRDNSFSVTLRGDPGDEAEWVFSQGDTELYASVLGPHGTDAIFIRREARGFQYLGAERNGPRITHEASALPTDMLAVGCRGEFAAHVIEKLGSIVVDPARILPSSDAPPLVKAQTEQWLSRIARPVEIDTATFNGTDVVSLSFRSPGRPPWVRPTNMGFGVSYALPVVLAALTAPIGGLLIVENPEAHLHPAGQSEAGMFLAQMASAGIQVMVETHSDHVLNGIRRAIAESRGLRADDAIVHFFGDADSPILPLTFTPTGGMSDWPRGFFDQYQLDVAKITRVRRAR